MIDGPLTGGGWCKGTDLGMFAENFINLRLFSFSFFALEVREKSSRIAWKRWDWNSLIMYRNRNSANAFVMCCECCANINKQRVDIIMSDGRCRQLELNFAGFTRLTITSISADYNNASLLWLRWAIHHFEIKGRRRRRRIKWKKMCAFKRLLW